MSSKIKNLEKEIKTVEQVNIQNIQRFTFGLKNKNSETMILQNLNPILIGDEYFYQIIEDFSNETNRKIILKTKNSQNQIISIENLDNKKISKFCYNEISDIKPAFENDNRKLLILKNEKHEILNQQKIGPIISSINLKDIKNIEKYNFKENEIKIEGESKRYLLQFFLFRNRIYRQEVEVIKNKDLNYPQIYVITKNGENDILVKKEVFFILKADSYYSFINEKEENEKISFFLETRNNLGKVINSINMEELENLNITNLERRRKSKRLSKNSEKNLKTEFNQIFTIYDKFGKSRSVLSIKENEETQFRSTTLRPSFVGNEYYKQIINEVLSNSEKPKINILTISQNGEIINKNEIDSNLITENYYNLIEEEKIDKFGKKKITLKTYNENHKIINEEIIEKDFLEKISEENLENIIFEIVDMKNNRRVTSIKKNDKGEISYFEKNIGQDDFDLVNLDFEKKNYYFEKLFSKYGKIQNGRISFLNGRVSLMSTKDERGRTRPKAETWSKMEYYNKLKESYELESEKKSGDENLDNELENNVENNLEKNLENNNDNKLENKIDNNLEKKIDLEKRQLKLKNLIISEKNQYEEEKRNKLEKRQLKLNDLLLSEKNQYEEEKRNKLEKRQLKLNDLLLSEKNQYEEELRNLENNNENNIKEIEKSISTLQNSNFDQTNNEKNKNTLKISELKHSELVIKESEHEIDESKLINNLEDSELINNKEEENNEKKENLDEESINEPRKEKIISLNSKDEENIKEEIIYNSKDSNVNENYTDIIIKEEDEKEEIEKEDEKEINLYKRPSVLEFMYGYGNGSILKNEEEIVNKLKSRKPSIIKNSNLEENYESYKKEINENYESHKNEIQNNYESFKEDEEKIINLPKNTKNSELFNNEKKNIKRIFEIEKNQMTEKALENLREKYDGSADGLLDDFYRFSDYVKNNNNHKYSVLFASMFYFFLEKKKNRF